MLNQDVFCSNSLCEKFDKCDHNPVGVPVNGEKVIFTNLDGTEFCSKYEKEQ